MLDIDQSKDLLRKLAPRLEEESDGDLEKLADWMNNLPLALDLAGRYLAYNPDMSLYDYLLELEEASGSLHACLGMEDGPNPTNHKSLEAILNTSWKKLDDSENGILAKRIFMMCGYCAPNRPIPKNLLEEAVGTEVSKHALNEARRKLDRLGLTAPMQRGRMLHSLLARFALWQDQQAGESVFPDLARAMAVTSAQVLKRGLPEEVNTLHQHLKVVTEAAGKSENLDRRSTAALLNNLGLDLQYLGDYQSASEVHQRALDIEEKFYGPDHFEVARTLNNLGLDLQYLGDYQSARECLERALHIFRERLGETHPYTRTVRNNLDSLKGQK